MVNYFKNQTKLVLNDARWCDKECSIVLGSFCQR